MTSSLVSIGSGDHHVLAVHGWFGSARGWGSLPDFLDRSTYTYAFMDLRGYGGRQEVGGAVTLEEGAADAATRRGANGRAGLGTVLRRGGQRRQPGGDHRLHHRQQADRDLHQPHGPALAGELGPGGVRRVPAGLGQDGFLRQGPAGYQYAGQGDRGGERPGPVRRRDGADLAGLLPRGRDDDPAGRRPLPDVRVAGVARHLHRGVPGARLVAGAGDRPAAEVVSAPATYVAGVPFEALARLRRAGPVTWV